MFGVRHRRVDRRRERPEVQPHPARPPARCVAARRLELDSGVPRRRHAADVEPIPLRLIRHAQRVVVDGLGVVVAARRTAAAAVRGGGRLRFDPEEAVDLVVAQLLQVVEVWEVRRRR